MSKQIILDGHNDVLMKLEAARRIGQPIDFFKQQAELEIDAVKAQQGGFCGGLFAMYTNNLVLGAEDMQVGKNPTDAYDYKISLDRVSGMMAEARRLVRAGDGYVEICTTADELERAALAHKMGIMLHIEGCEAIDANFNSLEMLYSAGLRSLGPVWSRDNIFAVGVPFDFPLHPDQGAGLSDLGVELINLCNQMNIMVDLSHINEKGFWDVAKYSEKPLMATHSNVYNLCNTARNLTDKQLDAIADTGGIVGLNFATGFLNADGDMDGQASLETMIKHTDYMLAKLGEDGVALGSDFDGAPMPTEVKSTAQLPNLIQAFKNTGYSAELIDKICYKNWLSHMRKSGL
ncbi:MAG: membrane dipeptidase [Rhizobiales bacterium]|nr:dipeptidase [Hyphomicrobiales bacterium]NRB15748.1 membrane dipeptidase [Hyphomicrobiales bacterium]